MPVKLFFCYAHEDEGLLKKIRTHLTPMQRQGLIEIWHDRDINAGTEWELEINKQLNTAQIILLLVSPDFMASDYCYGTEMKRALEWHNRKEALIIPVILRPVYWQGILGNIQALPMDGKPVMGSDWHNQDEAFFYVAEGIRKVVEEISRQPIQDELLLNKQMSLSTQIQGSTDVEAKNLASSQLSSAPHNMYPARQATIYQLLCQLVDERPELERDICSETTVRFGVKNWDIPMLKAGKKWPPSGRILLFTIEIKRQSLDLQLGLGWGPEGTDTRERLFQIALANEPPFLPMHFELIRKQKDDHIAENK
jgi:hypothetical protein